MTLDLKGTVLRVCVNRRILRVRSSFKSVRDKMDRGLCSPVNLEQHFNWKSSFTRSLWSGSIIYQVSRHVLLDSLHHLSSLPSHQDYGFIFVSEYLRSASSGLLVDVSQPFRLALFCPSCLTHVCLRCGWFLSFECLFLSTDLWLTQRITQIPSFWWKKKRLL